MAHARFYSYRLPTVTIVSQVKGLANFLQELRPDIPTVEINAASQSDDSEIKSKLREAEIIFGDPAMVVPYWDELKNTRWFQSTWAGNDALFKALTSTKITAPPFAVTRFAGSFGPLMAEYVIGHIIANERQFFGLCDDQKQKKWDTCNRGDYRPLSTLTVGILGIGDIGKEIARICKAFGMNVWGMVSTEGREEQHVDHLVPLDRLPELLHESNYVCNVLPSTSKTHDLLSGEMLSYCRRKKSVFINVGRGDVIDEASILHALKENYISKAILDVFNEEPLPKESALWEHPDVHISPHISSVTLDFQVAKLFGENFDRFVQEQPLRYVIDWSKGY